MAPSKGKISLLARARRNAVLRGWVREEDGSIMVFAMIAFIAILMVAGLAVDMARYEENRIVLQGATDRAVLAATMMRASPVDVDPADLVRAYMRAEGVEALLPEDAITIDPPWVPNAGQPTEAASRTITVIPRGEFPTMFMRWVGVDDLQLATPAQAVESLGSPPLIEVVMVLDVSSSMNTTRDAGSNGRMRVEMMVSAAREMVTDLLRDTEPGDVAISLVPYSTYVNLPTGMLSRFNNIAPGSQQCIDFEDWSSIHNTFNTPVRRRPCTGYAWMNPLVYQHDAATINARLAQYTWTNTTSIDLGIRSGAMFFDPSIRPYIESLVDSGAVNPVFRGRPHNWDGRGTVRAMVVLTDGDNCCNGGRFTLASTQDTNAKATCQAIRNEGILIYSIAYGASSGGLQLMRDCASSPLHFFNTSGSGIADVFQAIRTNIEQQALRLTL